MLVCVCVGGGERTSHMQLSRTSEAVAKAMLNEVDASLSFYAARTGCDADGGRKARAGRVVSPARLLTHARARVHGPTLRGVRTQLD